MSIPGVIRFRDLIGYIPSGSYYLNKGTVLPYRYGNTELRLDTGDSLTVFSLYIDEKFSGWVNSDVNGNVVFSRHFDRGDIEITLENTTNGNRLSSWISVREYALWLVAYAEVLETVDDNIQTATDDLSIGTSTSTGIQDHFGDSLGFYKDLGQDLDTYRWSAHGLRTGFRKFGTRYGGVDAAVAEITHIPPFGYARRKWGPNWVLDQNMVVNHRFKDRGHSITKATDTVTGVTVLRAEPDVVQASPAGNIQYTAATNSLLWTYGAALGTTVVAANGDMFLPGPMSSTDAWILGLAGVYANIAVGDRDHVYLNMDEQGIADITLTTGLPGPTTANVAADINFELGNAAGAYFLEYGVAYAAVASVYNGKLLLQSPASGGPTSVQVLHGAENAAIELFGNKPGDLSYGVPLSGAAAPLTGVEVLLVQGAIDLPVSKEINYEYDPSVTPTTRRLQWRSTGAVYGAWVSITTDGRYTLTDSLGFTCDVFCIFDDMPILPGPGFPDTDSYAFSVGFMREYRNIAQGQGIWVNVDTSLLPAAGVTTDNVNVVDDATGGASELPDNWRWWVLPAAPTSSILASDVITDKENPLDPAPAYKFITTTATRSSYISAPLERFLMPRPGPRGQNFPQRSTGMLYDYEGYNVTASGWFRSYNTAGFKIGIEFSWDGGGSWIGVGVPALATIVNDVGALGYEDPTFVSFTTRIPAEVTDNGALVRVRRESLGTVSMDGFSVEVEYITSRSLTRNTIPRTRHRQYFGELLWVWSSNELTTKKKQYLGLFHKVPNIDAPISGVTISAMSDDSPTGSGTLEYEYNSVGPTFRLRWNPFSGAWSPGNGWVSIVSDGTYNLLGLDQTYMTVDVIQAILPVLLSTPPAATSSRTVVISDISNNQGLVREVSPAHSKIEIFDVSEYDSDGDPLNVKGAVTEADFSGCTLINLDIVSADPIEFSYLIPNIDPVIGEVVTFATPAPHLATLVYESDQDQLEAVLYEDGELVPNVDEAGNPVWWFNSSTQIQIDPGPAPPTWFFNTNATYTLDYNPLFRVTTPVINLGLIGGYGHVPYGHYPYGHPLTFTDYVWFIDYYMWDRMDTNQAGYTTTTPVYFNRNNGRAKLTNFSDKNLTTSTLVALGEEREEVPKEYWRYLDKNTIEIDIGQHNRGVQYYLTYEEQRIYPTSRLTTVLEHRYGLTSGACLAASWETRERNEAVPLYEPTMVKAQPFHQLRLSTSGIRDLQDFKIKSLVLKGLHMNAYGADIPGLTNMWS